MTPAKLDDIEAAVKDCSVGFAKAVLLENADALLRAARFGIEARATLKAMHDKWVMHEPDHFDRASCCDVRAFLASHPEGT